jgi:hypothetical protein
MTLGLSSLRLRAASSSPRRHAGTSAAMTIWAVAAKMNQDGRGNRAALISLGIPKLVRFAKIPMTKSQILHCRTYYLHNPSIKEL